MSNMYIASGEEEGGIYLCTLSDDGEITVREKTELDRPMFLARENDKMFVLLRAPEGEKNSALASFDIKEDGSLCNMSALYDTHGVVACHLTVDSGDVYVVNYLSGNVVKMPDTIDTHEGKGPNEKRQEMPHTHFVTVTPDNFVAVTDLGTDSVYFYDRDLKFKFRLLVPAGYGARHLAFSENKKYLYVANELVSSVSVFSYDGENSKYLATYKAAPDDFEGNNLGSAIRVHGGRVYMSNRGHDSIAVFESDGGKLALSGYIKTGRTPRDFNIFADLLVCLNMDSDSAEVFSLEGDKAEKLSEIKGIKAPLCVID